MRRRAWLMYLVAGSCVTLCYLFIPGLRAGLLFNAIGLSSPIAILIALRIHGTEDETPWRLIALGQVLFVCGDVITYNYPKLFGGELPFPSVGDILYLSVYPCLIAGMLLLVRRRSPGRNRDSAIDSFIVAIGVGVFSWVFLLAPYTHDTSLTLLQKLTSMGYPLMDLMLLTVAIRLVVGGGRRNPAFYLLLAAVVALFVTDGLYGWISLHTLYDNATGYLEGGWALFYLLFGAAALHPSMPQLSERAEIHGARLSRARLALLAVVSLTAPLTGVVLLLRSNLTEAEMSDELVLIAASVALFLLVIARMSGLVRRLEQSAGREQALREAGAALVTATNREAIHEAAIEAAVTLAGSGSVVRLTERTPDDPDVFAIVASTVGPADLGGRQPFDMFEGWRRDRLAREDAYVVPAAESIFRGPDSVLPGEAGSVFVSPLFMGHELHGMVEVATPSPMSGSVADSLRALSSQVALALESAALTEDLLRRKSEARFASLVKNSSDVVTVIEPTTEVRYASPSAARVLGFEPSELEGTRFVDLIHPDDKTRVLSFLTSIGDGEGHTSLIEFRVRHREGSYLHAETLRTNLLHDPTVKGIVLNTRDITERKGFEEQLAHQAFNDPVTNLANRALFRDRVLHAMERQERDHRPVAVLLMDLDDFKTINDSLGHAAGDLLLAEVGDRLKRALRAADTAARLGGDEFAVLLEDGGEGVQAADVADRIMQMLEGPFSLDEKEVFVRASIGIAVAEGAGAGGEEAAEELMRNADVAMYMAKDKGKGRYQVFEPEMHDTALRRLELKADLQRALEHQEFVLHYQPVIELETGRISGVEALIRWRHPQRGLLHPLEFIPLAEETGLIVAIGRWVLREACQFAIALQERFEADPPLHMAVNLSARQISRHEIVDEVQEVLTETGLEPSTLILEITESMVMQDMELAIERLRELKTVGVLLAIDDFGTGYSSLNYVRRFPVDILKVDKSFIDEVSEGGESSALTAAVIELAGILKLTPVAEGIERADQLERLTELHCDLGQGYFFARPLPPDALNALLSERRVMETEAQALAGGP